MAPGPHKIEVWGDVDCFYCTGGVNHQGTVREFDVTPPVAADFLLAAASSVTIQRGRQGTVAVTVNRNAQMHDAVNLAAPSPPPGITVNFQPNPVPQDQQNSTATASAPGL